MKPGAGGSVNGDRRLTRQEAARLAGVSTDTIDRWVEGKLLPVWRYNARLVRISEAGLRQFMESRYVPAAPPGHSGRRGK